MTSGVFTAGRENGHRRPRGYAEWRPQRKTQALLEQIDEVLEEYADYLPLTVRQIFYRLVGQHGYDKTESAYERLAETLVRARRARRVSFDSIRDDGTVTIENTFYGGIEDFHDETAKRIRGYRRDRQVGQPQYIELWCEAAGMLRQLAHVTADYSVPTFSCGGFSSLTAVHHIAGRALARNVPTCSCT